VALKIAAGFSGMGAVLSFSAMGGKSMGLAGGMNAAGSGMLGMSTEGRGFDFSLRVDFAPVLGVTDLTRGFRGEDFALAGFADLPLRDLLLLIPENFRQPSRGCLGSLPDLRTR
jgi:hypothetical protein